MDMQKVSLILTTYNSAENLRKTLQSIDMQDYAQIEVNIKDGGSTDETIAVIENYEKSGKKYDGKYGPVYYAETDYRK